MTALQRSGAFALLVAMACFQHASCESNGVSLRVNPIRRVVNMLQGMTKKIEAEGAAEEDLFDKFMCYCKNGRGSLEQSIAAAEDKIPKVQSAIDEMGAQLEQLTADIAAAKKGREEAKAAMANGKALREKEASAYAKESGDDKTNIAAMGKAITALEKGASGFLQTSSASVLRKLSITMDMSSTDRDMLSSFLSMGQSGEYAPQTGQITGILKQMKDTMEADLAEITSREEEAKKAFESMAASKSKEIAAMTAEIEDKTARVGEDGVKLVNLKEDLEDTEQALKEDKAFLAELDKNCATKEAEWAERQKIRAEEILAVHETIKILNDDDALDLFKKTLPTPALLQLRTNAKAIRQRALAVLTGPNADLRLNFVALALKGRKVSFEKVLVMIDEMVKLLGNEQTSDDDKKAMCDSDIDKTEDELKALERKVADLEKAIDEHKGAIATVTEEIAALDAGVKALDDEVAEATEHRKEEHSEFVETLAANNAAVDLLGMAKNRLQKFYNPKLYKPAPKRELSAEDRISVNFGGTAPPTAAPGGIAGTGVVAFAQDNPGAAPETWGKYEKSGEESTGVLAMIDMLVGDLDKEIQTMEVDEKNAQEEYEELMKISAEKRASDVKSIADKESAKADLEANLQKLGEESKVTKNEAMGKGKTLMDLHADCDWLLQNFQTRKEARAAEVDSLKNAKAVLSGADYS